MLPPTPAEERMTLRRDPFERLTARVTGLPRIPRIAVTALCWLIAIGGMGLLFAFALVYYGWI